MEILTGDSMTRKFFIIPLILLLNSNLLNAKIVCLEDPDNDGFAANDAREISAFTSIDCKLKKGVVLKPGVKGDCAPNISHIHPGALELADNQDNNCNELIDESVLTYTTSIPAPNTTPALNLLEATINSQQTHRKLINNEDVYFRIKFEPLAGIEQPFYFPTNGTLKLNSYPYDKQKRKIHIAKNFTYPGLKRFTAYKIRFYIYSDFARKNLLASSQSHYAITGGNTRNPLSKLENKRLKMGLIGLKQVGDSFLGKIGVNGTVNVDGTRFGAEKGGTWCDEFWAWIAKKASNDKGFKDLNPDNVPGYFRDPKRDGMWDLWAQENANRIPGVDSSYYDDGRGKWGQIFFDPYLSNPVNAELGDMLLGPSHVFMFFSYDPIEEAVYTIEGNVSNKAMVRKHKVASILPLPGSVDIPKRQYILGIGRLKFYMFNQR